MFFIGILGIDTKQKSLTTRQNVICPICERYGRYEILKIYTFFHFFFIPIFRWNVQYFVRTSCCQKAYLLDKNIGERIEKGENLEIRDSDLTVLHGTHSAHICPACGEEINPDFRFCPHCGKDL